MKKIYWWYYYQKHNVYHRDELKYWWDKSKYPKSQAPTSITFGINNHYKSGYSIPEIAKLYELTCYRISLLINKFTRERKEECLRNKKVRIFTSFYRRYENYRLGLDFDSDYQFIGFNFIFWTFELGIRIKK